MRRILGIILSVALALLPGAQARPFHGGAANGSSPGGLITSMTISNTSGSTQATNFVTQIFGHPFKRGDIPNGCSGGAPQFQLTDGTNVPFSEGLVPFCWSDGSLKWAPFMLKVPASIAGSGSLTINILSGGTTPSASGRTTSDFTAGGLDLNVSVTGIGSSLSGTWISNLSQGISAAHTDDYAYMDGGAGKIWRIRASFRQSSADHGQLEGYWFAQALNNGAGTLGGIRYMVRITQPWYNCDGVATGGCSAGAAKSYRAFGAIGTYNGVSLIRDVLAAGSHFGVGKTFTCTTNCAGVGYSIFTATSNNFENTFLVRLTTTGSLYTGLSTGTDYFACNSSPILPTGNTFNLGTGLQNAAACTVSASGACTGTCTATAYPFITQFGSMYTAESNGLPSYIQGAGSVAADSTTRLMFNQYYWRSTKMVPPYALETVTPVNGAASTYYPNALGPINRYNVGTGDGYGGIGVEPSYFVQHFFNQDAADESTVRTVGLGAAVLPVNLKSHTTYTPPVINAANGTTPYVGMPVSNKDFVWTGGGGTVGFTQPTPVETMTAGLTSTDFTHMPEMVYYPCLVTGDPGICENLAEWGLLPIYRLYATGIGAPVINASTNSITTLASGYFRNITVNGVTRYGHLPASAIMREMAWSHRTMGDAAAIGGGYEPAGANIRQQLYDNWSRSYLAMNDYVTNLLPAFASAGGMFNEAGNATAGVTDSWMLGYEIGSDAHTAAINDSYAPALAFVSYMTKWWTWIYTNFGGWNVAYYEGLMRKSNVASPGGNAEFNPYLTSTAQFGVCGFRETWSSSTSFFTMTQTPSSSYLPRNGDQVIFWQAGSSTVPSAMAFSTTYYMVNKSGSTYQLSATLGGSPITLTDSGTQDYTCVGAAGFGGSTGSIGQGGASSTGIVTSTTGHTNLAKAAGATVDAATIADMNTRNQSFPGYIAAFNADPKYAFGDHY